MQGKPGNREIIQTSNGRKLVDHLLLVTSSNPKTLAAAEHLVARLEEAYEFSRSGKEESSTSKKGNNGDQSGKQKKRNFNAGQAGK